MFTESKHFVSTAMESSIASEAMIIESFSYLKLVGKISDREFRRRLNESLIKIELFMNPEYIKHLETAISDAITVRFAEKEAESKKLKKQKKSRFGIKTGEQNE